MHCETHGKALGDGPDLALVHGWGIDQSAWQPVASALARTFRVHLVGLPGYGGAAPAAGGFAPTAQRLVAALPAGVILCAWSLGAMLAQHAARLAPERVSRLILVASTPSFTQRADWPHGQPPALLESFATAVGLDPDAARQRFIALLNQGDGGPAAAHERSPGSLSQHRRSPTAQHWNAASPGCATSTCAPRRRRSPRRRCSSTAAATR